jgi:microcystin-dependent protein
MAKQLVSVAKNWDGAPEIDTYIPSLADNANIEEAFKLFMYGNFNNGIEYDEKSLYNFLVTFKTGIQNNETAIAGHAGQSNNVHNLGTAGPAGTDGGNVVGVSAEQTLTNKTLTAPKINENVNLTATSTKLNYVNNVTSDIQTQINTITPVGTIVMYGGTTAPTGWLLCNGQSTSGYASLAAVVGGTVPDLMGRSPIGYGSGAGLTARTTISAKVGSETHALSESEMPRHNHPGQIVFGIDQPASNSGVDATTIGNSQPDTGYRGGDGSGGSENGLAHNNMQPSTVVNFIIKT